jgi:hypothetical protein
MFFGFFLGKGERTLLIAKYRNFVIEKNHQILLQVPTGIANNIEGCLNVFTSILWF